MNPEILTIQENHYDFSLQGLKARFSGLLQRPKQGFRNFLPLQSHPRERIIKLCKCFRKILQRGRRVSLSKHHPIRTFSKGLPDYTPPHPSAKVSPSLKNCYWSVAQLLFFPFFLCSKSSREEEEGEDGVCKSDSLRVTGAKGCLMLNVGWNYVRTRAWFDELEISAVVRLNFLCPQPESKREFYVSGNQKLKRVK